MPVTSLILSAGSNNPGASTTNYTALATGGITGTTTDANAQRTYRTGGTLSMFYHRIASNAASATSTARVRVNAANGSGVLSIAAGGQRGI